MSERRPFRRAQPSDWWARPPYRAYTLRELTGAAIALYGGILFAGLLALSRGAEAFASYTHWLAGPWSLLLHLLLLLAMLWHVVTWFQILPKTMPKLILRGQQVDQRHITAAALAIGLCCSILLLLGVVMVGAWS